MTAKIITVCNQKGGSGKTCVAMTLAASFGSRGYDVVLVDGDVQGTATLWYAGAPEDKPFPAAVQNLAAAGGAIVRAIKELIPKHDIIVIDTPPSIGSPVTLSALLISDLALVPMIPSPGDLWATGQLVELVNQAKGTNDALQVRVVPNMVQVTTLAGAALTALDKVGLPVAKSSLTLRTSYRQALAEGTTVLGLRDAKAIEESEALADEALDLVGLAKKLKKKSTSARA